MSAPELVAGSVVAGKYTIRSLRLHGGAAASYRAVAAKSREVVLRIVDPAILSFPDVLPTLAQQQSIIARLGSKQIVPIVDSGTESNSGAPFTVTDCEPTPSLAQAIDHGPLSTAAMVALVRNLARAIDLLHANGVVGLSLHPGNVFVDPAQHEVRLADFGANLVRAALPVPEKAGRWMPWLAPEQLKGPAPSGQAADIFALGLTAFFAVTGKPYWRSSQSKSPDLAALRREILGERMPVSVRAGDFSIALNPAVDTVFARALAFRSADRYATAREFAVALEAAISGRSVAEVDAARSSAATDAAATAKTGGGGSAAQRAAPADAPPPTARMAPPPPRKMLPRATMVGIGAQSGEEPAPAPGGPRRPLNTMLGMGEAEARAVAAAKNTAPAAFMAPPVAAPAMPPALPKGAALKGAALNTPTPAMAMAPAKATSPAMATAPAKNIAPATTAAAKASPATAAPIAVVAAPVVAVGAARSPAPATPVAQAKATPPPMPISHARSPAPAMPAAPAMAATPAMPAAPAMAATPAMPAAPAMVVAPTKATQRMGGPPALPMAPPPAQLEDVLARFEASSGNPWAAAALPAPPSGKADVAPAEAAWPTAAAADFGGERVETGVAVIGADFTGTPKKSRLRWVASVAGLVVLMGGAAFALTGRTSGAGKRTVSDPKAATAPRTAEAHTASPEPAGIAPQPAEMAPQAAAEEARTGASLEPVAPGPAAQEPAGAEPALPAAPPPPAAEPVAENDTAAPISAPGKSAPASGPTAPRPQASSKPCGKFLKRCK